LFVAEGLCPLARVRPSESHLWVNSAFGKLATTNPIESCLSTVQRVARNVKRWREEDQPLRWTATGLLEAEKKFRRIKGYQEILLLKERLNPSRIQQKEVRTVEVA
jgi:hypothetical protein